MIEKLVLVDEEGDAKKDTGEFVRALKRRRRRRKRWEAPAPVDVVFSKGT